MLFIGYQHNIKKHKPATLDEVYSLLNITRKAMSKWRNNPTSTQTTYRRKHETILSAARLFGLGETEKESLANKAGLSLLSCNSFAADFTDAVASCPYNNIELCELSLVGERTLRNIKSGNHLRKETVTALLLNMGLGLDGIQELLRKAGFVLSNSLPNDIVVMWMMENELKGRTSTNPVIKINEILYQLGLPLLMARSQWMNAY